jgi:hypothetical protein
MNKLFLIAIVIMILTLVLLSSTKSQFIGDILNQNYKNCNNENIGERLPQGKIPGSYLGLTPSEKEGLLKKFIENSPYN